jgi:hypothetical protein
VGIYDIISVAKKGASNAKAAISASTHKTKRFLFFIFYIKMRLRKRNRILLLS